MSYLFFLVVIFHLFHGRMCSGSSLTTSAQMWHDYIKYIIAIKNSVGWAHKMNISCSWLEGFSDPNEWSLCVVVYRWSDKWMWTKLFYQQVYSEASAPILVVSLISTVCLIHCLPPLHHTLSSSQFYCFIYLLEICKFYARTLWFKGTDMFDMAHYWMINPLSYPWDFEHWFWINISFF